MSIPSSQIQFANKNYSAVKEADAVVYPSPIYFRDIAGTLKTAVDRLGLTVKSSLSKQKAADAIRVNNYDI